MTAFPGSVNLIDAIKIENGKLVKNKDLTRWYFEARLFNIEKDLVVVSDVKSKEYQNYRMLKQEATIIRNKLCEF